ncbi:Pkinase-domain-containing protein [Punctularia strigosozonata HHB-11173 SS5]|uniref:Pkinase-domain-containing protein n=1 Tax=Punctularia strigosozonata (strain HHB-11173) TaxID=741275 RepID=UPI0004416DC9|nr:Pkinase-domain-containing protein [Punctularia strigosozonata HHB-11173 SS5]EIN08263.1 Pkinase-domain-containing protein [Punctularia strigosozonata HHB-11173 SS5]
MPPPALPKDNYAHQVDIGGREPRQDPAKQKAPSSPPLPRQNTKTTPPSPPKVIRDLDRGIDYVRVGLLGEGGFARVYEVKDARGQRSACKVVTNSSLKTKKAKTKLYAEIKIHRSLNHPNIVAFHDCFEDQSNVYLNLELCPNGSLMDLLRRRRRMTEPESRVFMVQLLGACRYMHDAQVIHRDLKLGNLFLDAKMNVKVGDFGLAALIESPGERKKTICGTPNYIAPEVLFDTANGHSFEVDTWSIGVILYTLVIGRPPFQTKEVKLIYKRIRDNEYDFPPERPVSYEVQALVKDILTPNPAERPSLVDVLAHEWFVSGCVPPRVPVTAHDSVPDFSTITRSQSAANLAMLRRNALLDDDQAAPIATPEPVMASGRSGRNNVTSSLAQQEKEFQHAVQPGSPISALLRSAKQPLVVAPGTGNKPRESPLFRKLQAAAKDNHRGSPLKMELGKEPLGGIGEEDEDPRDAGERGKGRREKDHEELRRKELESQKARIVAQMAPARADSPEYRQEPENVPPVGILRKDKGKEKVREAEERVEVPAPAPLPTAKPNGFDAAAATLTAAFEARALGRVFRDPRVDAALPHERVFIVSWVDYCNKYGMGYALTDGSVGVHFNDSTTIVLSADKVHLDYISSRRQGTVYVRKNYTVSVYPEELKSKVYLLKHFERYIMDRLYGDYDYTFEDVERTKGMDFVQKYLRMKHVIVFKMSHDSLQFNFYDHSKIILSSQGLLVTHIDKNYNLTRQSLAEIMAGSLQPSSNPDKAKFNQRLVDKLKYCKEVLLSIRQASSGLTVGGEGNAEGLGPHDGMPTVSARTSKASLR